MAIVDAERKAVDALRAYLLRTLPAKCTEVNAARAPALKSPIAGPYNIGAAQVLKVRVAIAALANVPLTVGAARTAAQVAVEINAVVAGNPASADAQGRLVIPGAAPTANVPGVVEVAADTTGANAALGFSPGGELLVREGLSAPGNSGIVDGEHSLLDIGSGFGVIVGDKSSKDTRDNIRYDERDVSLKLSLHVPVPGSNAFFAAEALESVATCVRSAIFDDRTLDGAVQIAKVLSITLLGPVFQYARQSGVTPLMAQGVLTVLVRVFERTLP